MRNNISEKINYQLENLAGFVIYERGLKYFERGMVSNLTIEEIENSPEHILVSGEVRGDDIYVGNFIFDLKNKIFLEAECDCPFNHFCKHTVALALEFSKIIEK